MSHDASRPLVRIANSHPASREKQRCRKQKRHVIVSRMITLLSVVGDSDVRAKDTEVGEGIPLTSPFIEEIYGKVRRALTAFSTDPSNRSLRSLPRDDREWVTIGLGSGLQRGGTLRSSRHLCGAGVPPARFHGHRRSAAEKAAPQRAAIVGNGWVGGNPKSEIPNPK